MPSTSPIIIILGAGERVGFPVAKAFAAKGYRVALAARKLKESDSKADELHITSDFSYPLSITTAFAKVNAALGVPSVVVYNGGYPCLKPQILETWNTC